MARSFPKLSCPGPPCPWVRVCPRSVRYLPVYKVLVLILTKSGNAKKLNSEKREGKKEKEKREMNNRQTREILKKSKKAKNPSEDKRNDHKRGRGDVAYRKELPADASEVRGYQSNCEIEVSRLLFRAHRPQGRTKPLNPGQPSPHTATSVSKSKRKSKKGHENAHRPHADGTPTVRRPPFSHVWFRVVHFLFLLFHPVNRHS